jgi:hypothetical protein
MEDYKWIKTMLIEQKIDDRLSIETVKRVYQKLIEVAKKQKGYETGIIFYEKIMAIAGLEREDPHDRETVLGRMLGGISEHEEECGRPLLSAVVVLKDTPRMPSKGFYYFNDTDMSDEEFWFKEIKKVWDYWSKH